MGDVLKPVFLLVDHNVDLRKIGTALLREMGFEDIYQARTGTEAWSMIKNYHITTVISAWDLPDMSGLSLLKIIRADLSTSHMTYLLVAESLNKSQVLEAGESGVSGILMKPLAPKLFKTKIKGFLEIKEDPKDIEFKKFYEQGKELMTEGRYEDALAAFERLLSIYESAEIYYNVGYIKTAQGKYEEAIMAFQKATRIDNSHALAFHKMAEAYNWLGRRNDAQDCFEKAAEIYLDKYMDENAEEALNQALKLNPKTLNVFNSLGILYRRQGKYQEAIRAYRRALKINPTDENIHYNLARVYLGVDNYREARKVLVQALSINAGFDEARDLLESIKLGGGLE